MADTTQDRLNRFTAYYLNRSGDLKEKTIQRWHLATDIYASGVFASGYFDEIKIDGPTTSGYVLTADAEGWGTWQESHSDHSLLDNLTWSSAGHIIDSNILPNLSDTYDIGGDGYIFRDIYMGGLRHSPGVGSVCGVDLSMTGAGYTSQINFTGTDYTHVFIQAGAGVDSSKTGRNATIKGGSPYTITGSATGGSVYLTGANGNGTSGVGGSIIMTPGTGAAASGVAEVVGKFGLRDPGSIYYTYISSPILSSDMTYVMPKSMPPASGYVLSSVGGTDLGWIQPTASAGALVSGASCVQSPVSLATKTTQAHGLGKTPDLVVAYYECLSADNNYSVGDRIMMVDEMYGNGGSMYS